MTSCSLLGEKKQLTRLHHVITQSLPFLKISSLKPHFPSCCTVAVKKSAEVAKLCGKCSAIFHLLVRTRYVILRMKVGRNALLGSSSTVTYRYRAKCRAVHAGSGLCVGKTACRSLKSSHSNALWHSYCTRAEQQATVGTDTNQHVLSTHLFH